MSNQPRVAVITGSTSGIGLAIAKRLLNSGYRVTLNYAKNDERASQALAECKEINPEVLLIKSNISKPTEAETLISRTVDEFGALDVLINNAAHVADKPLLDMTEAEWDSVLDVNLKGAFLCSQLAARQMQQQDDGGVILNIGAATGIRARRNGVNTCASKAALMIMTQCLALELAPKIRANTIIPGTVITEETAERFGLADPTVQRERIEGIPMQRLGQPEDMADAVILLLSAESHFITGQKIIVDGGQNMQ